MIPTDLVVILPGIMGSQLRQDGHLVWGPSAGVALRAIATFGRSVRRLQLPDGIGDDHPCDGVEPAGIMPDLHLMPCIWTPIEGYDVLLQRLRSLGYRDVNLDAGAPAGRASSPHRRCAELSTSFRPTSSSSQTWSPAWTRRLDPAPLPASQCALFSA